MTLLPIVVRELRVTARSRSFYRARFWTAFASVVFGSYLMFVFAMMSVGRAAGGGGREIFGAISGVGLFYCILLARNTADCVSEEKREGTLGLLFLTDLKGYDVVLGKLCANSVRSFYCLLATVPVVSLAVVMGGVNATEVWRTVLALLNVFFFSQAAGLLISTLSRDHRRATAGTAAVLVAYFIGIPLLMEFLRYKNFPGTAAWLGLFNPTEAYSQAGAAGTGFGSYWISLLAVHLNAWAFLGLASLVMPGCWQDKPSRTTSRWKARVRQWCYGPPEVRTELRRRLMGVNPFLWLVSRNRLGQIAVWGVLGLIAFGWILIWHFADMHLRDSMPFFVMIILLNHGLLKFWIASEASIHLSEQRRSGALEYLLSCTPLSVEEILRGQWLALYRRFLAPVVAVLVVDVALMAGSFSREADNDSESLGYFVACVIAAMVMLLADALAIGWLGMWRAMVEKKRRTASGETIFRILVLPWLIWFLMMAFGGMAGGIHSEGVPLFLWFILGIGTDVIFGSIAHENLLTRFRAQAAVQPDETLGLLGQLGRFFGEMARR
jgi:ABC-type transport system involved in cytochrome c biogenesis permease component